MHYLGRTYEEATQATLVRLMKGSSPSFLPRSPPPALPDSSEFCEGSLLKAFREESYVH